MTRQTAPPVIGDVSPVHPPSSAEPVSRRLVNEGEIALALQYRAHLKTAASETGIDPLILCAVVSRESSWGLSLTPPGPGGTNDWSPRDPEQWGYALPPDLLGWKRGLMGIDYREIFAQTGNWRDPAENLKHGAALLAGHFRFFSGRMKTDEAMHAAIAAYNCGRSIAISAVRRGVDPERHTIGGCYCSDVMTRHHSFASSMSD